jgi:hypothetical protein
MELKRLSAGYFTDRDTAVAVSAVDLEPATDKPELQALIRRETHAENKTLRQELNTLKQQLAGLKKSSNTNAQKSVTRGPGGSASKKTKNSQPESIIFQPKQQKAKQNNNSTDGNTKCPYNAKERRRKPKKNNNNKMGHHPKIKAEKPTEATTIPAPARKNGIPTMEAIHRSPTKTARRSGEKNHIRDPTTDKNKLWLFF